MRKRSLTLMRKRFLTLSFATTCLFVATMAQGATMNSSQNLLSGERIWNYEEAHLEINFSQVGTPGSKYLNAAPGFHFEGQKSIGDKTYEIFLDGDGNEVAYMRQDAGKVYLSSESASGSMWRFTIEPPVGCEPQDEYLLYDFDSNIGDSFMSVGFDDALGTVGLVQEVTVTDIQYIKWGEHEYKALTLKSSMWENEEGAIRVIEGVGPQRGLLCNPQFGNPTSGMSRKWYNPVDMTDSNGGLLYRPYDENRFFSQGKKWIMKNVFQYSDSPDRYMTYKVSGETMVDGQPAAIISVSNEDGFTEPEAFYGYENNGVVYVATKDERIFRPMLDFNVVVNQKLSLNHSYGEGIEFDKNAVTVVDVDRKEIAGVQRKVVTVDFEPNGPKAMEWIDEIGSPNPDYMLNQYEVPDNGSYRILNECWEGDRLIFNYNDYSEGAKINTPVSVEHTDRTFLYDVTGRRVLNPQKGAIYIREGQKVIF